MELKGICEIVQKLYIYADETKKIHYTTPKNHTHELCDEVRDTILDFVDDFAEQMFGIFGKPSFNDFVSFSKITVDSSDDLYKICESCINLLSLFYKENKNNEKLSGIISLIDDFKGKLNKMQFLTTFDKITNDNKTY